MSSLVWAAAMIIVSRLDGSGQVNKLAWTAPKDGCLCHSCGEQAGEVIETDSGGIVK